MSFDTHNNFGYGTVQGGSGVIGSGSGTTIILGTAEGLNFSQNQNAVVWPSGVPARSFNAEVVRVTNVTGDTLTVTRAQESTTALTTIAAGYQVSGSITKKVIEDIEAAAGAGGVSASTAIAYAIALG